MNAFRCGVETWLARYAPQRADAWQPQTIASALQHDLDDLALTPIDGPVLRWETQLDPSFTMGVHYVLEGSSLGARVLCAQVASFGLHRNYGARHLWVQAEHPNGFRAFIDLLSDRTPALDEDRVIAGANAAFTAAAAAMECASHA